MPGKKYANAAKPLRQRRRCTNRPPRSRLVKSLSNRKFDETVEVAFRLGVDPRKADQMIARHRLAAARHRQERARRGVRRRATPPRPRATRAPTSSVPTIS